MVLTTQGTMPIAQVVPGTEIVSYNQEAGVYATSVVGEVVAHTADVNPHDFTMYPLVTLSVQHEGGAVTHTKVTNNHPYFDAQTQTFKAIGGFAVGDILQLHDGEGTIISMETTIDGSDSHGTTFTEVYDLLMSEGPANYIVDDAVVLA
jgi:hypothetical protein